jgi:amidase
MPENSDASRRQILAGGSALVGAAMLPGEAQAASSNTITAMDGLALAAAIKSKKVSCVEVMTAYLDHIGRTNPKVNAIVSLQPRDKLLAEAKAKDTDLAAGRHAGFLHGFPLAPKDLTAAKGIAFTDGSPLFKNRIAQEDSLVVARMRAAGGIMIGKTNAPEFGMGSQTYNQVFGTTFNAYDQRLTSGGSSGGASVALATHMLPVTDGSDNCGSLRNPAGWNNIYGFRTTFGRIPSGGFLFDTSVTGPMARTVPDLAWLLSVQAGPELKEPLSIDEDPAIFAGALDMNVKGVRIGWLGDFGGPDSGGLPMEPGVLDVCRGALKSFENMGAIVSEAKVAASVEDTWQAYTRLRTWASAANYGPLYDDPAKRSQLKAEAQWEVEQGRKVTGADMPHLLAQRLRWYQAFVSLFDTHDFLVAPTAQVFAFDAKTHWPDQIAGRKMDSYLRWMQVCGLITMTGCPVLAAPAGFDRQSGPTGGRSMGIQIIGKPRREIDCLKIANAYDQATRWPGKRPSPLAA